METYIAILSLLLLSKICFCAGTAAPSSPNKYSRIILESSNSPNLSISLLNLQPNLKQGKDEDNTTTWKTKGFSTTNISWLVSQYPSSFRLPSPSSLTSSGTVVSNTSKLFHSSNETATLTIVIREFKHALMYLNFSYYVGTFAEKSMELEKLNLNRSSLKANFSIAHKNESSKSERQTNVFEVHNTSKIAPQNHTMAVTESPSDIEMKPSEEFPQINNTVKLKRSPTFKTASEELPDPIPIIHDMARRKRSVFTAENVSSDQPATNQSFKPIEVLSSPQNEKLASSGPTPNASTTGTVNPSITLVQAVEMIKTAAAAISKGAAAANSNIASNPNTGTGHTVSSDNDVPTSDNNISTTESSNPIKESGNITKSSGAAANVKNEETSKSKVMAAETQESHHHHHHHKSKTAQGVTSTTKNTKKSGNKGKERRKSKSNRNSKKPDTTERISGQTNDHEKDDGEGSSSSSSSSEEEIVERVGGKKKISYKTWRASFEKKNRPPGLYVTINDDIIFDNWEGLWEKQYLLGRWTGSSSKPLGEGMWNLTQLFMNWEDGSPNSVKITFEWEPMNEHSYLVLSDILVSTLAISPSSCASQVEVAKENATVTISNTSSVSAASEIDTTTPPVEKEAVEAHSQPIIIIKHSSGSSGDWQIIKMGKAGSTEIASVNYKELQQKHVDNTTQTKLIGSDGNDGLLQAVLKTLQAGNGELSSNTSRKTSPTLQVSSPPVITTTTPISSTTTTLTTTVSPPTTTTISTTTTPAPPTTKPTANTTLPVVVSPPKPSNISNVTAAASTGGNSTAKTRQRNEDRESALLVSIVTGSIAVTILILTLKKYVEVSDKQGNNNSNSR